MSFSLPHNLCQEYIAGQKYAKVQFVQENFDACISASNTLDHSLSNTNAELSNTNARLVLATPQQAGLVPSGGQAGQFFGASDDGQSYGFRTLPPAYQIGEFRSWFEQTPPPGWAVRNGAVLTAANVQYPKLWAYLQATVNNWKCKTLAEWTALSTAAGGVGGVPYFVLDTTAKTIKLPDTRGDYTRGAGSSYLSGVGAWHADAIKSHTHAYERTAYSTSAGYYQDDANGGRLNPHANSTTDATGGSETRTRAFGLLPCVYIGGV